MLIFVKILTILFFLPFSSYANDFPACFTHGVIPDTIDPNPLDTLLSSLITPSTSLSADDKARYQDIFALQEQGNWKQADQRINALTDRRLLGHVLFQRYMHPTDYRSTYQELTSWLKQYRDHPGTDRVKRLAEKRDPDREPDPVLPISPSRKTYREIHSLLISDEFPQALARLKTPPPELSAKDYETLLNTASYILYHQQSFETAIAYTQRNIKRQSHNIDLAYKIAGLSAWRLQNLRQALAFFQLMNRNAKSEEAASFARFWSAKALLEIGKKSNALRWMKRASLLPRTFYGFLAQAYLNQPHDFSWRSPSSLKSSHIRLLLKDPNFQRGLLLFQIEQFARAEQELIQSAQQDNPLFQQALLAIAIKGKLALLALNIGSTDNALYPQTHWQPASRYRVDKALLYGLIRQESYFQPEARSSAGAIGLMQIMPATAQWISQQVSYLSSPDVYAPEMNLSFGQWYLSHLLDHPHIQGNLIMLLAAYNAGPGAVQKWRERLSSIQDPLLFIESISFKETRHYVRQVLFNYWIYQMQFNQTLCSAYSLAHGKWPFYRVLPFPSETPRGPLAFLTLIQSFADY